MTGIKRYLEDYLFAFLAFFIVLTLAIIAFIQLNAWTQERRKDLFHLRTSQATEKVVTRMNDYIQILKGGKAIMLVKDTITGKEWESFYNQTEVEHNYPGIQGIGYAPCIRSKSALLALEKKVAERVDFRIKGLDTAHGELFTPILYLEPDTWRNRRGIGFDMYSDSVRRAAMDEAADSAEPILSGVVRLIKEGRYDIQYGIILYVPIYRSDSVKERRNHLRGFVFSTFRANDLFSGILKGNFNDLSIIVSGLEGNGNMVVLYSDVPNEEGLDKLRKVEYLNIAGQLWKITYSTNKYFGSYSDILQPYIVLSAGCLISILIFFILWFFASTRRANKILQTVTSNATAGLFMVNQEGVCTFINHSGEEMLGYNKAELKDKRLADVVYKGDGGLGYLSEATDATVGKNYEDVFMRKDGTSFDVAISSKPVLGRAEPKFTIIEVRDISEEKQVESQIKLINEDLKHKNEQLNRINTDLDSFIYTASHDLKAPVSNIEGLVNALEDVDPVSDPNSFTEITNLIKKSVFRFKNTIQDLTDITKIQKNFDNKQELVDIKEVTIEVLEDLSFMIKESGSEVNLDIRISFLNFNKSGLKSLIYNLLSNAVKYRDAERKLVCNLSLYRSEGFVVLEVKDNGLGIPENQQNKVFGMFKRMHSHVEGSGVGLYIVKRMIENTGGRVELISREGVGSTFRVYFTNQGEILNQLC